MKNVTEHPTSNGTLASHATANVTVGAREQLKQRRPGEIIGAAFEEFKQKGYAATRLDDVAKRVGVSKGTIYLYFSNKEELFRAVVRSLVTPTLDKAEEITAHHEGDTALLLRRHLEALYHEICQNARGRGLLRLLISESETFPELTEFYHREVMSRGNRIIGDVLRRGVARGEFRADALVDFPQIVVAPVMMLAMHRMMFGERHPIAIEPYMESHIALVLAGLEHEASG
jgi:AcrR family transcriptional regulator